MERIIEKIIKKSSSVGDVSVTINNSKTFSLVYGNDELSNTSSGDINSLDIRVSNGKNFGYSTTNLLSNWEKCLERAIKIMKVSKPIKNKINLSNTKKIKKVKGIYSKNVSEMSMEKMFEKSSAAMDVIKTVRKDITVPMAKFSKGETQSFFGNSNGVKLNDKSTVLSTMIQCGLGIASGVEGKDSHFDFDFVPAAREAARMCADSLNPKAVHTMKTDLILDYFAASDLIESSLVPSVLADNVHNNKSYLKGKIGKKVFSDKISIVDDGLMENGLVSGSFDAEGSPMRKTEVISKGVLKNYLYDIYSAKMDKKITTGNCNSISKVPSVGISNFILKPGDYSRDEIIEETKQGILTKFVMGTHFVNPITGDASIGLNNAFLVEKGCIVCPIKQAMMFVNIFDALKKIEVIGNNIRQDSPVVCPTIKLKDVQIIT